MSSYEDAETGRRNYKASYTPSHPVPTVQRYREEREEREGKYRGREKEEESQNKTQHIIDYAKRHRRAEKKPESDGSTQPYQSENKNIGQDDGLADDQENDEDIEDRPHREQDSKDDGHVAEDTSQTVSNEQDPKRKRKAMKKRSGDRTEREVTDPVTHLPVTIHDFTADDLKQTPENGPPAGSEPRSATGGNAENKDDEQLRKEQFEIEDYHQSTGTLFPPPDFAVTREEITYIYKTAMTTGLGIISITLSAVVLLFQTTRNSTGMPRMLFTAAELASALGISAAVILGIRQWTENRIKGVWESEVWQAERHQGKKMVSSQTAESTQWLNSLLASIWPLVNPDLFTSVADTLEDVMQASLPRMVRMVSVDDIGQGSEALRILGVRWLPTGAAAKTVCKDGKLRSGKDEENNSDRTVPGQGEVQQSSDDEKSEDHDGGDDKEKTENFAEGMEAEEGDFVNVEIAFAYRPRTEKKGIRNRAKNAHLYLAFYLPANVKLPVWVELHGIVGTMRLRLQLMPDPPFFALCTLTFLGQPKVDLSCIPLIKRGPNIMDLPLISNFVQSSVDAAMAEYVAPKSLTLDLKDMLVGDGFKKDTTARGVLVVRIKRAFEFKDGDPGIAMIKKGSADPYVSVGWAKFGKPVWSTRIILTEMNPHWEETSFILVTPEELNVDERLRVQLWDSDKIDADDDLGRIEVDIKELMRDSRSNGKMWDRIDGFKALKADEVMPGKLEWSVGYFSKKRITDVQLARQEEDPSVKTIDQLKSKVYEDSGRKLREAKKDESKEIEQQKAQDLKARQDHLIIGSPPPQECPSGILSIEIHQITSLELEAINKNQTSKNDEASYEQEECEDLPSAYCTVILNHQKVFKTRTKAKNSKPFFNAGCERFIRDFRNSEIHVSVRDARVHEDDPLLGIIYLPLSKIFAHRSQVNGFFPLTGGVGYGRVHLSLVFRSIQLDAPKSLLGWDYGTVEVAPDVKASNLPKDLEEMRLKVRTNLARGKMQADSMGGWKSKSGKALCLPVRKRYCSPLVIEFRTHSTLVDHTPVFAVLWLKDIPDGEEQAITLPVWKGDLKRAQANCLTEYGEQVGSIKMKLTFWSGLSGYHAMLAGKDRNIADVMEVLDTCHDNDEMDFDDGDDDENHDDDKDSESDPDSDEHDKGDMTPTTKSGASSESLENSGKRGVMDQIKDYKQHTKQLHRRNRGLMQWKGPRTLQWMKHKVEHTEQRTTNAFHHHERDPGIETEI
ncbi:meiotically up-regulated gene 190 protein [Lepidopterella palustris CBS 459.81]|uniref:Meiotically up-regulated gene 190 protein n=1 Tax=Lepidopterella palustris CBS 459.81 TaxID=1314670 RepID=A0A8E2JAZ8_9PEZI|nr:meiotically up-regulated gene 190 protein [Lepidopterella palustris CBS 459.81]